VARSIASGTFQPSCSSAWSLTTGAPYLRVFLKNGKLLPGQSTVQILRLKQQGSSPSNYTLTLLSGQGKTVTPP
jgi:hypothetical protein